LPVFSSLLFLLLRTQLLLHRSGFVAIPLYIQQICRLCQERTNASHPITSLPIPSHHILYILLLELERTFFSSSFSHSIVWFFVSSEIWSFLMLSLPSRAVRRK
jgi:hypothetical protein